MTLFSVCRKFTGRTVAAKVSRLRREAVRVADGWQEQIKGELAHGHDLGLHNAHMASAKGRCNLGLSASKPLICEQLALR